MPALIALVKYGLDLTWNVAGDMTVDLLRKHFVDHGQALPKAISRANNRTWQAFSIALAGDGFVTSVNNFFASRDSKGIAAQIKQFVDGNAASLPRMAPEFRKACLTELKKAKQAGLLSADNLTAEQLASKNGTFAKYTDFHGMIDGAKRAVDQVASSLPSSCPNLAKLLRKPTPSGPPLVAVAFSFFFSREIESNADLSRRLTHDSLQRLHTSHAASFERIFLAFSSLGGQVDVIIERLGGIEDKVQDIAEKVDQLLAKNNMSQGEVKVEQGFSIRGEDERLAVKALLAQFRQLSPEEQKQLPELLNKLGKLQYGSGDFKGATHTFDAVADNVSEASTKAEAHYNAYRSALEAKKWTKALEELRRACDLDPARFSPFPLYFYQPKGILGAGGFGAAVLCYGTKARRDVVVKTFHADDLERSVNEVFQEAEILKELKHSAIIGVQDWGYADSIKMSRPYIVMEYFPGVTLEAFVSPRGVLSEQDTVNIAIQIAEGMQAAHQQGVLHRDLKPANLLVRKEGNRWQVKIIDFGLALRRSIIETSVVAGSNNSTLRGESAVGTYDYAPPEQMGKRKEAVGPCSDIYSFAKVCCFAKFQTLSPDLNQWLEVSRDLAQLLGQCTKEDPNQRPQSFEEVLAVLKSLPLGTEEEDPELELLKQQNLQRWKSSGHPSQWVNHHQGQWTHQDWLGLLESLKRSQFWPMDEMAVDQELKLAQQEFFRKQQEEQRRAKGEFLLREILDRTHGKPSEQDKEAVKQLCKEFGISLESYQRIRDQVKEHWRQRNPAEPPPSKPDRLSLPTIPWKLIGGLVFLLVLVVVSCAGLMFSGFGGSGKDQRFAKNKKDTRPERKEPTVAPNPSGKSGPPNLLSFPLSESQAKDYKKRWADHYGVPVFTTNKLGMKFAFIPPGSFVMGSPVSEIGRVDKETQHKVTLTKGFYVSVTEVTQAQWRAVMNENNSNFKGDNNPVDSVSWNVCKEFVGKLNGSHKDQSELGITKSGKYTLLTEAQWEYACRAGTTTEYHSGNGVEALKRVGWYGYGSGNSNKQTHPAQQLAPNAWGLYDMHGNVFEWCQDWYGDYPNKDIKDPQGAQNGNSRVLRGGSWSNLPAHCRSACRGGDFPVIRSGGCRVAFRLD